MSRLSTPAKIGYFGKIPSRGDFIKASDNLGLISLLDQWIAQSMELLAVDPRWKIVYDEVKPLHFVFMGPRSKRAIAGHLIATSDQAQRRFPFLSIATLDLDAPLDFVKSSPLVLARLWNRLDSLSLAATSSADATSALQELTSTVIDLELQAASYDATFNDFLEIQTVGALDQLLSHAGFQGNVRQLLLALGSLLQPVMASATSRLEKSLVLPLPADPMYRYLVATLWMRLIAPFLERADFELALFILQIDAQPNLVLGFGGASPRTLHAIMNPRAETEYQITFADADWVESQLDSDYGLKKLSTYLSRPSLSLKAAHDAFREAFLGA
jgi:type VI secretion system protein ImpM